MSESGLNVHDLSVVYGRADGGVVTAVDNVSVHVPVGDVLVLLGPSGCGKSSLLRAVIGLEPLAGGQVLWDGEDVTGVPVHERGFGLMFQDGQLFPHKSVGANVVFGLQMAKVPARQRRDRVAEMLELVDLTAYANRPVATLSGGERQRVALARALAPRPRLLLLDEPLSALDRSLREHLAGVLRGVLTVTGTTAIMVTHDHDEAVLVADEIAIMQRGRILQRGTAEELWQRPVSLEVAEFLGYERAEDGALLHPPTSIRPWNSEVRL